MNREAQKLGLQVLFHEKPFAGINGSGKHANWSIGTDTGLNFFYPGKNEDGAKLYVTAIACLAYGLAAYNASQLRAREREFVKTFVSRGKTFRNPQILSIFSSLAAIASKCVLVFEEMVRCTVAHAGNDHRLGAQEAPPAIISLYPGQGFEQHVEAIVAGGDLLGYKAEKKKQATGCSAAQHIEANVEDRNRTAPFPFCGNRFEFRAVGSSQNCCLPVMVCNAMMSAGMAHLAQLIEGGMSHRDAVAQVYKEGNA